MRKFSLASTFTAIFLGLLISSIGNADPSEQVQRIPQAGDLLESISSNLPVRASPPGFFTGKGSQIGTLGINDRVTVLKIQPMLSFDGREVWLEILTSDSTVGWVFDGLWNGILEGQSNLKAATP